MVHIDFCHVFTGMQEWRRWILQNWQIRPWNGLNFLPRGMGSNNEIVLWKKSGSFSHMGPPGDWKHRLSKHLSASLVHAVSHHSFSWSLTVVAHCKCTLLIRLRAHVCVCVSTLTIKLQTNIISNLHRDAAQHSQHRYVTTRLDAMPNNAWADLKDNDDNRMYKLYREYLHTQNIYSVHS